MKRSIFLLIIGILNLLLGVFLTFATSKAAETFGITDNPQALTLMRSMGTMLLSIGVLNIMVRNEPDSGALRSILVFNIIGHGLGLVYGLVDAANGTVEFAKVAPGLLVPFIGTIGSIIYLLRIKKPA